MQLLSLMEYDVLIMQVLSLGVSIARNTNRVEPKVHGAANQL